MRLKLKTAPAVEPVTLEEAKLHLRVDSGDDNALITALITTARELAERETKRAFITQTWQMYLDQAPVIIEIPKPPLQSIVSIKTISVTESTVDETSALGQAVLSVEETDGFVAGNSIVINRDGAREEEKVILSVQTAVSLTLTTNLAKEHTAAQADRVEKYELVAASRYNIDASENSYGRVKLRAGSNWPIHRNFASFIVEFIVGYGDAATDVPEALKQAILMVLGHLYENRGGEGAVKARVQAIEEARILLWPFKILRI